MRKSKYAAALQIINDEPSENTEENQEPITVTPSPTQDIPILPPPPVETPAPRERGRPRGKRATKDYQPTSARIYKGIYRQTKIKLFQNDLDYEEVVERLLEKWVAGEVDIT